MRQALVTTRALGRSGLRVGVAESPEVCDDPRFRVPAFASRWSAWNSTLPSYFGDPATYARFLLDLVQEHPTRVLMPSTDGSIAALRPWRSCFERQGVALALASESALSIANNKERTLAVAEGLGIAGPRTAPVTDPRDALAALAEVGYPAVIKPTESWVRNGCRSKRLISKAVLNETEALAYIHELSGIRELSGRPAMGRGPARGGQPLLRERQSLGRVGASRSSNDAGARRGVSPQRDNPDAS